MKKVVLPLVVLSASTVAFAQNFGDLMYLQNQGKMVYEAGWVEGNGERDANTGALASGTYTQTESHKEKFTQRALTQGFSYGTSNSGRLGVNFNYAFKNATSYSNYTKTSTGLGYAGNGATENDPGFSNFFFNYQHRFMREATNGYNMDLIFAFTPGFGKAYTSEQSYGNGFEAMEGNNRIGGKMFSVGTQVSKVFSGLESVFHLTYTRNFDQATVRKISPFQEAWDKLTTDAHNVWDFGFKGQYKLTDSWGMNFAASYKMTPDTDVKYGAMKSHGNDTEKVSEHKDYTLGAGIRHFCSATMFMNLGYTYASYDDFSADYTAQGATTASSRKNYSDWANHTYAFTAGWNF